MAWLGRRPLGAIINDATKRLDPKCQLMKMKLNRKMKNPNREKDMSDEDFVFADLGKQISSLIITFIPDE